MALKYLWFQDSKKATKGVPPKAQNLLHRHFVTFIQNHLQTLKVEFFLICHIFCTWWQGPMLPPSLT